MPTLIVSDPSGSSRPYDFSDRALIGRDEGNDVRIPDPTVSGHHALVMAMPDGTVVVKDLRSANGTRVDGEKVRSRRLRDGEFCYVGGHRVMLRLAQDAEARGMTLDWEYDEATDPSLITGPLDLQAPATKGDIAALEGRSRDLMALYALANAVHSCTTEDALFNAVASLVQQATGASNGALVEQDPESGELVTRASWPEGLDLSGGRPYSRTLVDRVVRDGQTILVPDVALSASLRHAPSIVASHVRTVICAPLRSQSRILGIIFASHADPSFQFQDRHVQLLTAIGLEAGTAMENQRLFHELERDFFGTVRVLVYALEARDAYTGGHAQRVASIAVAIARCIPLDAREVRAIRLGALLHDIGKIGVVDHCLKGSERLSDAEYAHVKEHTIQGDHILAPLRKLEAVRGIVRHHHERWDGRGYPDGLAGEDIPLAARIVGVADTLDAIASNRNYSAARSVADAVAEIERVAGSQLDPGLMPALRRARQQGFIRPGLWSRPKVGENAGAKIA